MHVTLHFKDDAHANLNDQKLKEVANHHEDGMKWMDEVFNIKLPEAFRLVEVEIENLEVHEGVINAKPPRKTLRS